MPQEIQTRQTLEGRLRTNPNDRATMIGLATLVATKREYELGQDLLDRAAIGITGDDHCASLLRKMAIAHVAVWKVGSHTLRLPHHRRGYLRTLGLTNAFTMELLDRGDFFFAAHPLNRRFAKARRF